MEWETILIAIIPALVSGFSSYWISRSKTKADIKQSETNQKAELDKAKLNHQHELERLELKFKNQENIQQNQTVSEMMNTLLT